MKRKKPLQEVMYVLGLVAAIVVLFFWYTTQNSSRMEERNKNYAADSARQTATLILILWEKAFRLRQSPLRC